MINNTLYNKSNNKISSNDRYNLDGETLSLIKVKLKIISDYFDININKKSDFAAVLLEVLLHVSNYYKTNNLDYTKKSPYVNTDKFLDTLSKGNYQFATALKKIDTPRFIFSLGPTKTMKIVRRLVAFFVNKIQPHDCEYFKNGYPDEELYDLLVLCKLMS